MMPRDVGYLKYILKRKSLVPHIKEVSINGIDHIYEESEETAMRILKHLQNFPSASRCERLAYKLMTCEMQCYEIILEEVQLAAMQELL